MMRTNRQLFAFLFFAVSALLNPLFGQQVIMEERVDTASPLTTPTVSENGKRFTHGYIAYGILPNIGYENHRDIGGYWYSLGLRHRRKISGVLSITGDLNYNLQVNDYKPSAFLIDPFRVDLETKGLRNRWHMVRASLGPRFNFDPNRGDHTGIYLEIKPYVDLNFSRGFFIRQHDVDDDMKIIQKYKGYSIDQFYFWGIETRLGFGSAAFVFSMRQSEMSFDNPSIFIQDNSSIAYMFGIEIGFF